MPKTAILQLANKRLHMYSAAKREKLIIDLLTEWKEKHAAEEAK